MVCLRIEDFLDNRTGACDPAPPPPESCLCFANDPIILSHISVIIQLHRAAPICKKKLHCASSNSASNVHFCLACSFFHPPVQFSRLALHTSKLNSDICRSRKTFLTLYQLHSLPWARLRHRTYRADLYFYLHRANNTQTKANIFLRQHGPSTGAKFFIWCLAEEMTICDHAACESWTEAMRFIPELQGSVCKNQGASCFKQDEIRYRKSSTTQF